MARTKYEQVTNKTSLKSGDVVTVVDLRDGKVYKDVTVTYVTSALSSGGFDARSYGRASGIGADLSFIRMENVLVIRERPLPANWPPKHNDVWEIDGRLWHYARTSGLNAIGMGASASSPDWLLNGAKETPKLLFRHNK